MRYSKSRRKACDACAETKLRCERESKACRRCIQRDIPCLYQSRSKISQRVQRNDIIKAPAIDTLVPLAENDLLKPSQGIPIFASNSDQNNEGDHGLRGKDLDRSTDTLDQSLPWPTPEIQQDLDIIDPLDVGQEDLDNAACIDPELVCPITPEDIQNRWLASYIPDPSQAVKKYSSFIIQFISRILKSYVAVSINGDSWPPFVHSSQSTSTTGPSYLHICLNIIRICAERPQRSKKTTMVIIEREMAMIYQSHASCGQAARLAIFQAYLVYSMVLHFWFDSASTSLLHQAIINLQELACGSVRQGIMCVAEQQSQRPSWEAWIAVESKRRTLYTMYLFDSVLSARDGLPSHLATELHGLPAPSKKALWQAQNQSQWQVAYDAYLERQPAQGLQINELWPHPPGLHESEKIERRHRVDEWLENIDEFGTMLFTVTSFTHGS